MFTYDRMSYPRLLQQRNIDGRITPIQEQVDKLCVSDVLTFRTIASEAILRRYPFGTNREGECLKFEAIQINTQVVQFLKIFLHRTKCRNGIYQNVLRKFWEWIVTNHRRWVEQDIIIEQTLRVDMSDDNFRDQVLWHDYFAPDFDTAEMTVNRTNNRLYLSKFSAVANLNRIRKCYGSIRTTRRTEYKSKIVRITGQGRLV